MSTNFLNYLQPKGRHQIWAKSEYLNLGSGSMPNILDKGLKCSFFILYFCEKFGCSQNKDAYRNNVAKSCRYLSHIALCQNQEKAFLLKSYEIFSLGVAREDPALIPRTMVMVWPILTIPLTSLDQGPFPTCPQRKGLI
jgi:hypothetical protein